jgi:hypothetical protein
MANSKPVKQEVNGTVISPPLVFPADTINLSCRRKVLPVFVLMLHFEIRTVLSKICAFSDNLFRNGHHIYMKWKRRERVQDIRETEGECV